MLSPRSPTLGTWSCYIVVYLFRTAAYNRAHVLRGAADVCACLEVGSCAFGLLVGDGVLLLRGFAGTGLAGRGLPVAERTPQRLGVERAASLASWIRRRGTVRGVLRGREGALGAAI